MNNKIVPYESLQQVFDKAYLGMEKQNWEPAFDGTSCVYTNQQGFRCAIGHTIPDEIVNRMPFAGPIDVIKNNPMLITEYYKYDTQIEYKNDIIWFATDDKVEAFKELKELFKNVSLSALRSLQRCHDDPFGNAVSYEQYASMIKANFTRFAHERELTIPS